MRILVRIAVVLAVLLVVVVGALALLLPSIVESEAVKSRIETAAEDALGREVRYEALDFGLLPPSIRLVQTAVAGSTPEAPPFAEAEGVALRMSLLPLLARKVVVDSLVVEGATLRLVRTPEGIELPGPKQPEPEAAPAEPSEEAAQAPVDLALRGLALRDATVFFEDRAVSPAVTWELRNVDARASGESLEEPFEFDVSLEVASGGSLELSGQAGMDGEIDVTLELGKVALAPVRPYLGADAKLAGTVSGTLEVAGPAGNPTRVAADLTLDDGDVALQDIAVRGPVRVKAELSGGLETPRGSFDLDASRAELRYGEAFHKPPGTSARVTGRIVGGTASALEIDDVKLTVRNADASARVTTGDRMRVVASVAPFELEGWDELLPALGEYRVSGEIGVDELTARTNPLDLRGTVRLDGVRAELPDQGPVVLRGALVAEGDAIRTQELTAVAAEQTLRIDGRVSDLTTTPSYRVSVVTTDADANELVSSFAGRRNTLYGLLDLDGEFSGRLGDDPVAALRGTARLDVDDGRLVGVSLLRAVFGRMGEVAQGAGAVALIAGQIFGGRDLQRFYGEEFETIEGTLKLANAVASTDDLRVVYRNYTVDLSGSLGLRDCALDMRGRITIDEEIDATLAAEAGGGGASRSRVITIPALGGSCTAPRPKLDPQSVLAFVGSYAGQRYGGKVEEAIDEALGEGAGSAVVDELDRALGGLLGGRKRK